eukprot:TRINITY_DN41898_c0_g1_i1.p1 TRINITY_DN41898_c0_g1~~TRINITY_DN41898_c0_g1_i1.p1  ORF type:complete len:741 (-),score=133.54 TRINITY_DN41898_c0_g1_i1:208-2430(-)
MSSSSSSNASPPVLDFDPREVEVEAAARTRRLLGRVLASQGPAGLVRALHVAAPRAAQLKHRVACVTCRSRLDALASTLAAGPGNPPSPSAAASQEDETADDAERSVVATGDGDPLPSTEPLALQLPPEGPAPLTSWLAADAGRGLAPAPRALRDIGALAAFLAAFGASSPGAGGEELLDESGRKNGRSGGVVRCTHHAPRAVARATAVAVVAAATGNPSVLSEPKSGFVDCKRERDRYVALLRGGTSDAEWRQLGTIDIDNSMCDLFAWLGDRGLCSSCIDAVTGALLEVRRTVAGTTTCTCSRCVERRCCERAQAALVAETPPAYPRAPGAPPELVRVQGRLRAICGVYRREPLPFNERPVYKKERAEAYLLYTSLKDWMVSGRADAGGARCEGWAYVTDPAETPDEICGVWKVSGPRGWEEDRSLCVTAFEELQEELRAGLGYDDGSAIARRLTANERGVLFVPLQESEVLEEVLWAPDEPPPGRTRTGACAHVVSAQMAQRELRCWLRWLLRDRLDAQRRRVLAHAQVGASLCRLFACAALQQLEQAAEIPAPRLKAEKKGRQKKGARPAAREGEAADDAASNAEVDASADLDLAAELAFGHADGPELTVADVVEAIIADGNVDAADGVASAASPVPVSTAASTSPVCMAAESDCSASTRASSEEPQNPMRARLELGAKRLMQEMGWSPEAAVDAALDGAEVAAWREQHPRYRQDVREERQKLKTQFQQWALATVK